MISSRSRAKCRLALLPFVAALMLSAVACNTIDGAGKDVEKGGEAVQETSKDVKRKL